MGFNFVNNYLNRIDVVMNVYDLKALFVQDMVSF